MTTAETVYVWPHCADYAWVVDSTLTSHPDDDTKLIQEDAEHSSNGTTGPHDAPKELLDRLAAGEGRVWRTLYDDYEPEDQRVCHVGRILDWHDLPADVGDAALREVRSGEHAEFGPLLDFSRPDSGAADIQYQQDDGTWKVL